MPLVYQNWENNMNKCLTLKKQLQISRHMKDQLTNEKCNQKKKLNLKKNCKRKQAKKVVLTQDAKKPDANVCTL